MIWYVNKLQDVHIPGKVHSRKCHYHTGTFPVRPRGYIGVQPQENYGHVVVVNYL